MTDRRSRRAKKISESKKAESEKENTNPEKEGGESELSTAATKA